MWHLLEMTSNVAHDGDAGQALRGACVEIHLVDKTETCFAIPCSLRSWLSSPTSLRALLGGKSVFNFRFLCI